MHNIDRTNLESNFGEYAGEYANEYAGEYAGEFPGEYAGEYANEFVGEYPGEFGQETETYGEYSQESPFSEAEEMELAAELLTIQNEDELEQFLGKLIKKAGGFLKSGNAPRIRRRFAVRLFGAIDFSRSSAGQHQRGRLPRRGVHPRRR